MTKGRDIAAESLGDLLDVARVQRHHGMLRAEYSQGGYLEEGEVYLLAGQPIYARTSRLVGIEALRYLLSWRNIHFAFVTDMPRPPMNIFSSIRQSSMTTPLGPRTQSLSQTQLPVTDGLRWNAQVQRKAREPFTPPRESIPGIEHMVPNKNGSERDIFSLGLTRRQRLIYFLIDGQRSMADLARTTSKTVQEIEVVVDELKGQGLIVF